ncbi:MAG TPA: hypothetical protein VEG08_05120, partial [Terriglobales bacterium]|nr:hypothetical protein [Terriglobales bacterium]
KSAISVASAILEKEPEPISRVQPLTPPALEHVVKTCLAKDAEERWQSAADVARQLHWISQSGSQAGVSALPVKARRQHREWLGWTLAVVGIVAAVVLGALYWKSANRPERRISSQILAPQKTRFLFSGDTGGPVTVSPDGAWLAFVAVGSEGQAHLWVQSLDGVTVQMLPGTEDATFPFWSADSRSLGFFGASKLKRVELAGGPPQTLCDAPGGRGGSWSREGVILFTPDTQEGLWRVSANGGAATPVLKVDLKEYTTYRWPRFLPDGKHFLYVAANHNAPSGEKTGVFFASLDGKENKLVVHTFAQAEYAQGELLFLRENTLLAQSFDPRRGKLSGEAAPVNAEAQFDLSTWHGIFSASETGVLAYQAGGAGAGTRLIWYDRSGKKLGTVGERQSYSNMRLSPDGRRLAVAAGDPNSDIFIFDLERGVKTRLTFTSGLPNIGPVWSRDGSRILFASNRANRTFNLYEKPSDGTGPDEELLPPSAFDRSPSDWSADGKFLAYAQDESKQQVQTWILPMEGERKPFAFLQGPYPTFGAVFSPDGRWLAYQSLESGQFEVYVTRFPGPVGKWQISSSGGLSPRWRRDGKELYFITPTRDLVAVPVNGSGASLQIGSPQRLFTTAGVSNPDFAYDVTADGQRFLINSLDEDASQPISLLVNWRAGMKK